ncbi:HD domain-containing protein [Candidatus Parcubacteria bacterium]|nr:HD domain-containing protein [Candidatus Parcubacteria bacterium]
MYPEIDLSIFPPEREEKLKSIYRYSLFEVMYYRSNLWQHSFRVLWILEALIPLAKKHLEFDAEKARALALVHDDAEIVTGDVQAGVKARMSKEELDEVQRREEEAVRDLVKRYPKKVHGYSYEELLFHSARKDSIEAKLVSYADKVEAYCESMHNLLAGNFSILRSVIFYVDTLALFPKKFPELVPLLSSKESPLTYLRDRIPANGAPAKRYIHLNKPHTKESILIESDFPFYNTWKKIILDRAKEDGLKWLTEQEEFFRNRYEKTP